jgi:hypothetical protein
VDARPEAGHGSTSSHIATVEAERSRAIKVAARAMDIANYYLCEQMSAMGQEATSCRPFDMKEATN